MKTKLSSIIVCLVLSLACVVMPAFALVSAAADEVTVSFFVSGENERPDKMTAAAGSSITLPDVAQKELTYGGNTYTFAGWAYDRVEGEKTSETKPIVYAAGASYQVTEDVALYAVYSRTASVETSSTQYVLAKSNSDLAIGKKIVIAADASDYALSTNQRSSNREAVAITKSSDKSTITFGDNVQIIELKAGKKSTQYGLYTGSSGYLYAAGSSSNYLKTKTTLDAHGSWDISISSSGVATIKATDSTNRNLMKYNYNNNNPPIISCYSSGQKDLAIYVETEVKSYTTTYFATSGDEPVLSCNHSNTRVEVTEPGKLTTGLSETICNGCGLTVNTEVIPAIGCEVSFIVPEGAETFETLSGKLEVTLPVTVEIPEIYNKYDYEFLGWVEAEVDNASAKPTFYEGGAKVTLTDDASFYALFVYVSSSETITKEQGYIKTNISDIKSNDVVVITMAKGNTVYALSSANGSSSSPAAPTVTVSGNKITSSVADALKWNISNNNGELVIYVNGSTSKWLYCTNSNSGVRVGGESNKAFEIDGTYGYLFNKATSRYTGVYNNSEWRCYSPVPTGSSNIANQTLAFYVYNDGGEEVINTYAYTTVLENAAPECNHAVSFSGASLSLGSTLAMNFYVKGCECGEFDASKYLVNFTIPTVGGEAITANAVELTEKDGAYYASFTGIAPQCMGMEITAALYTEEMAMPITTTCSVKQYAEGLVAVDANYIPVISALLNYGAAAQTYKAYDVENLVNEGLSFELNAVDAEPARATVALSNAANGVSIKSAGVRFDYDQKIYVKLNLAEGVDAEDVTVTIGGAVAAIDENNTVYSQGINAADFEEEILVTVEYNGEVSTLTYSVNAYAYNMYNNANAAEATKALVKAMYAYGAAVNSLD